MLTGALLTSTTTSAFAATYYLEDGDITISANENTAGAPDVTVNVAGKDYTDSLDGITIETNRPKTTFELTDESFQIAAAADDELNSDMTYTGPTTIVSWPDETETPAEPETEASHAPVSEDKAPESEVGQPEGDAEQPASPAQSGAVTLEAAAPDAKSPISPAPAEKDEDDDSETVVTYESKSPAKVAAEAVSNAVSSVIKIINNTKETLKVTLSDVNIDASSRGYDGTPNSGDAAVSVTGSGDTILELDGDNVLKSGNHNAALEHNEADAGGSKNGKLTIQDEIDSEGRKKGEDGFQQNTGRLTATGGNAGAGIGGGNYQSSGEIEITGGDITATGGTQAAGIGGGLGSIDKATGDILSGSGNVTISGGTITAAGGYQAAGIGGGVWGDGNVTITGDAVIKEATGGTNGAGIGGGLGGDGNVTISGSSVIENAAGGLFAAGIGGGQGNTNTSTGEIVGGDGNITISDNAVIKNAEGGIAGAGIGSGMKGTGNVTISGSSAIENAQGGDDGAGIGGGYGFGIAGTGNVTIEGNTTINAAGGMGSAGIGNGTDAGGQNGQITIRGSEAGSPNITATGGIPEEDGYGYVGPGGAGIGGGSSSDSEYTPAGSDITIEGKVTIVAKAGKDNAAIGDLNGEQDFPKLAAGSSITRYDSEGNDISRPGDKGPIADDSDSGEAPALTAPASPAVMLPGVTVLSASGRSVSYTAVRKDAVFTISTGRAKASLHTTLGVLRALREQGVQTIVFRTWFRSTSLSPDTLLALGGNEAELTLTHSGFSSRLTVGGAEQSQLAQ